MAYKEEAARLRIWLATTVIAAIFAGAAGRWSLLSLVAIAGVGVGVVGTLVSAWRAYIAHRDAQYDLSRLFEEPINTDVELDEEPGDSLYCEHCGIGYPKEWPTCPECGRSHRRAF